MKAMSHGVNQDGMTVHLVIKQGGAAPAPAAAPSPTPAPAPPTR